VCQTLERENLLENVQQRGEQLKAGLHKLATAYPHLIAEVRGWGLIVGMELQADIELTSADIVQSAIAAGVLLVPAGPKVLRFVPPLIVTSAEVDRALLAVESALCSQAVQ
jgi:acetylornithine aminotransferase